MATANDPTLDDRIQSLPQELQDIILNFTVAIKPDQPVIIDSKHKAPWQLQINRTIRTQQAPIYFGTSEFQTKLFRINYGIVNKWLRAQSSAHRSMITTIRYDFDHDPQFWEVMAEKHGWERCYTRAFALAEFKLRAAFGRNPMDVVEVRVRVERDDDEVEMVWAKKDRVREVLDL